jgi:hypothetical protein
MFPSSKRLLVSSDPTTSHGSGKLTALEASDSTALKATVLPILMSETIHTNTAVAMIALAGTWECGLTLESGQLSADCGPDIQRKHSLFPATWRKASHRRVQRQTSGANSKPRR